MELAFARKKFLESDALREQKDTELQKNGGKQRELAEKNREELSRAMASENERSRKVEEDILTLKTQKGATGTEKKDSFLSQLPSL